MAKTISPPPDRSAAAPAADATTAELSLVGKPFRRVDARAKVTGQTRFADDLQFPRMVYLKLVRSTVPHARIRGIDLSAARSMPGQVRLQLGAPSAQFLGEPHARVRRARRRQLRDGKLCPSGR